MAKNYKGYIAILQQCIKDGVLQNFKSDLLVHDAALLLSESAPESFAWGVRDSGTDLLFIVGGNFEQNKGNIEWAKSCKKQRTNEKYYIYDNEELKESNIDEVIEWLKNQTLVPCHRNSVDYLEIANALRLALYDFELRDRANTMESCTLLLALTLIEHITAPSVKYNEQDVTYFDQLKEVEENVGAPMAKHVKELIDGCINAQGE